MSPVEGRRPARVLVVDDDPDINDTLVELLEVHGYLSEGVQDGQAALLRLNDSAVDPPDIILLDLRMPRMDGWSFRAEQRRDPALARIPVVAMSGDASPQAETIDAAAFVAKPMEWKHLLEVLDRVLEDSRIAKRAEARAHRERLAALGRLSAGMAHEINNPLAWVSANLRMLRQRLPEVVEAARPAVRAGGAPHAEAELDDLVPLVDEALEGAARIAEVVVQVRSLSQPRASPLERVDVARVLGEALKLTEPQTRHQVSVVRELQPVPEVLADPAQLTQLFVNLLMNAADAITAKARGAGTGSLRVAVRRADEGIEIVIADDGVGIPDDVRRRIFDPFFTTKAEGKGAGLGLFLCHGIVTAAGGKLEVESDVGRGTTVRVLLPALEAGEAASSSDEAAGA